MGFNNNFRGMIKMRENHKTNKKHYDDDEEKTTS